MRGREHRLVDKFGSQRSGATLGVVEQLYQQQMGVESGPDDRGGIQRSLGNGIKSVDAGADGGVKGGGDVGASSTSPCTE